MPYFIWLPVEHCIRGTYGWEIREEIAELLESGPIDKPTFGQTGQHSENTSRSIYFMNFFILAAILLLLIPSRPVEFNPEYISMKQTNIIRGFFLLLVFMIHFCLYIQMNGPTDRIFQFWRPHSGQLVVTLFLLYSGYGVFVSIMKKGTPYVRRIPVHRVLRTLVHFDLAVLLYLTAYSFMGRTFSLQKILLALLG